MLSTSCITLSILKRGYPLEIPRALASFEVANTMSRVFWEWSKIILCFFRISYRELSFKFSLNKKEKDSGKNSISGIQYNDVTISSCDEGGLLKWLNFPEKNLISLPLSG